MKANTFKRGVHVPDHKEITMEKPVVEMEQVSDYYFSCSQHMGAPASPVVGVGDDVKRGQLIAAASGGFSANVYSSVSGTVKEIVRRKNARGINNDYIYIVNDFEDRTAVLPSIEPTKENILNRVFEAGIVGLGGAAFPTAVKLKPKTPVDVLVINGAECEPYLNCDYRLMLEKADEVVKGVKLIATALGVSDIYVGIEVNKPLAIELLSKFNGIKVIPLKKKYPQGAEKQLIYACTGRVVKTATLPSDSGCVVQNVATAYAIYQAVNEGKPLYERIMTISGGAVNQPKNILVRSGTPIKAILDFCGGVKDNVTKLILGGPMMGQALENDDVICNKADGGLLALTEEEACRVEPSPCINCSRCAQHCPMHLMPMYIDFYTLAGKYDMAVKYGVNDCFECGVCSYVCPAKRTLVQSIKLCKGKLKEMSAKK
ncbi:MAG: electron transport complex subunit RsxC [Clostridia bacterium]|nr:electron transport complex subunit RsxC [Clostridia bacterium]